jgi:GGDEF domain-containing protein
MTTKSHPISFGGDGTFDLLTNAYTPRFFYSHLDREIALANRAQGQGRIYPISLISFRLPPSTPALKPKKLDKAHALNNQVQRFHTVYEKALIDLARLLEKSMREGDVIARIYETGLVISTRNDGEGLAAMKVRMKKILPLAVEIIGIERKAEETRHSLIARLDAQYFQDEKSVDK